MRKVKGELFLDYVRMIRSHKDIAWNRLLAPEDAHFLVERIDAQRWYPMAAFERMGNAILAQIAKNDLIQVRMWGRYQVDALWAMHETLVAPWDPVETLCRFRVLRGTFFDFEAIRLPILHDDEAHILVSYYMGMPAEEAAAYQTIGFFERLLELSGASSISARFLKRSWVGDEETRIELQWLMGARPA